MTVRIPRKFTDIEPAWLTSRLREAGALRTSAVTGIAIEPIGAGAGFLGQVARLRLTYDRPDEGVPLALVGKLPTLDPGGREVCRLFRFYEREIRFYNEVTPSISLRVPRCYTGVMDVAADDYLILLEDLGSLAIGDDANGCSPSEAEQAIRTLAGLHRAWWAAPHVDRFDWLPVANAPVHQTAEPAYQQSLPHFLKAFGDHLSPRMRTVSDALRTHVVDLQNTSSKPPVTIVHGDYRLDNLFFGPNGVAVIDWQIAHRGRGVFDVAYFLSGCLEPAARRAEEMRLLRLWYELATDGGRGYTFEDALRDYRRAVLYCHVYTVIAIGSLDPANERGLRVFQAWLQRRSAAIEDLEAYELMPT